MKLRLVVVFGLVLLSVVTGVFSGCISSVQHQYVPVKSQKVTVQGSKKIVYRFRRTYIDDNLEVFDIGLYEDARIGPWTWTFEQCRMQMCDAFQKKGTFKFEPFIEHVSRDFDLVLEIEIRKSTPSSSLMFYNMFAFCTLSICPFYGHGDHILLARVSDTKGRQRSYELKSSFTEMGGFFVLFMQSDSQVEAPGRYIAVKNWDELVNRMAADGFFGTEDASSSNVKGLRALRDAGVLTQEEFDAAVLRATR